MMTCCQSDDQSVMRNGKNVRQQNYPNAGFACECCKSPFDLLVVMNQRHICLHSKGGDSGVDGTQEIRSADSSQLGVEQEDNTHDVRRDQLQQIHPITV